MGFQTTLMIKNDNINIIDEDPKAWWERTKQAILSHRGNFEPIQYSANSGAGFTVLDVSHSSVTVVLAVGQGGAEILSKQSNQSYKNVPDQVELLNKMARDLGYKLVKVK